MRDSETSGRFRRPAADRSRILSTECRAGTVAWRARFDQDPVAPKFRFRVNAEGGRGVPTRLGVEIGTCEIRTFDGPASLPLKIDKPGFSDEAANSMLLHEEMLATKLRALLWRDQGRGLCDRVRTGGLQELRYRSHAEMLGRYFDDSGQASSRARARVRMIAKLTNPRFLLDVRLLLPVALAEALTEEVTVDSFRRMSTNLIDRLPGEPRGGRRP